MTSISGFTMTCLTQQPHLTWYQRKDPWITSTWCLEVVKEKSFEILKIWILRTTCLKPFNRIIRTACLMMHEDAWWLLMTLNDARWLLMTLDDSWWFLMTLDDSWWLLMTLDDSWWLSSSPNQMVVNFLLLSKNKINVTMMRLWCICKLLSNKTAIAAPVCCDSPNYFQISSYTQIPILLLILHVTLSHNSLVSIIETNNSLTKNLYKYYYQQ